MTLSSRSIYTACFEVDVADSSLHYCICGKVYQQNLKSGYTNLLQHLKTAHKGYEALTSANGTLQPAITEFLHVDQKDSLNKWATGSS
ncbi:hypothetical protein V7S43_010403 [Phytophthora oleae]|uniref:BED-type domain-containing protein n=1 Tax=Phytophthora oleae TaxID=2107226 RepID=A0ABD3FI37_9STRA